LLCSRSIQTLSSNVKESSENLTAKLDELLKSQVKLTTQINVMANALNTSKEIIKKVPQDLAVSLMIYNKYYYTFLIYA